MIQRSVIMAIVLMGMAGCASVLSSATPEPTLYTLQSQPAEQVFQMPAGTMFVEKVKVPPGFDTQNITIFVDKGRKLDKYADAQWADSIDILVQDVIIRDVETMFLRIEADSERFGGRPDYILKVDVQAFHPIYEGNGTGGPPKLEVAVQMTMLRGEIRSRVNISQSNTASENTITAVTADLERSLNAVVYLALQELFPQN